MIATIYIIVNINYNDEYKTHQDYKTDCYQN